MEERVSGSPLFKFQLAAAHVSIAAWIGYIIATLSVTHANTLFFSLFIIWWWLTPASRIAMMAVFFIVSSDVNFIDTQLFEFEYANIITPLIIYALFSTIKSGFAIASILTLWLDLTSTWVNPILAMTITLLPLGVLGMMAITLYFLHPKTYAVSIAVFCSIVLFNFPKLV